MLTFGPTKCVLPWLAQPDYSCAVAILVSASLDCGAQDHPCAEQDKAQHTPRPPLLQTMALCISSSLANTKDLSLLKYHCYFWELFCAAPSCAAGWAIVVQNSREAHPRNYKMQVLLVGSSSGDTMSPLTAFLIVLL